MLLWHLAATTALTRYAFRDERMDLRMLFLGAVLPDLLDTPVGLAFFSALQSVRLVGHSLIFAGVLMALIVFVTRRGRPRKKWMPLVIGVLIHLFLDGMWADAETLWWPIFGADFSPAGPATAAGYLSATLRNGWLWAGEAAGLAYLVWLASRSGLGSEAARHKFVTTGQLDAPIGLSRS